MGVNTDKPARPFIPPQPPPNVEPSGVAQTGNIRQQANVASINAAKERINRFRQLLAAGANYSQAPTTRPTAEVRTKAGHQLVQHNTQLQKLIDKVLFG